MSNKTWGIILVAAAICIIAFVAYKNSPKRRVPIIFSPRSELLSLWEEYKIEYLEPETFRTLDKQKDFITTSEGQSYTMLRAVWVDDKETFDRSWKWTKDNLQRDDNKLFSWLFGRLPNGSYGILSDQGGYNTATDADVDIALALIFASARWNDETYLGDARVIIDSIWEHEVVMINGRPYLAANNVEKTSSAPTIIVNPSYFAPYAYKIFGRIDPEHPWDDVVDTSYEVLQKSIVMPLDRDSSANLPPDWIALDEKTGALMPPTGQNLTTNMSFDALRVPWRLALDWQWFRDKRAKDTLTMMNFLGKEWQSKSVLYTAYSHDGEALMKNQTAAFYGGTIGYFMVTDPKTAEEIHANKLQILFSPDTNSWKTKLGYYDDNWAWFGIALYNDLLPNLAAITNPTNE